MLSIARCWAEYNWVQLISEQGEKRKKNLNAGWACVQCQRMIHARRRHRLCCHCSHSARIYGTQPWLPLRNFSHLYFLLYFIWLNPSASQASPKIYLILLLIITIGFFGCAISSVRDTVETVGRGEGTCWAWQICFNNGMRLK